MNYKCLLLLYVLISIFLVDIPTYAIEISDTISKEKGKKLKEIVVESSNIKQEGENTVINITKSMRKGTVTTEQMLGNIPGFFYEPSSGVKYNGSENFILLMDSVPKSKTMIYELNNIKFDKIVIVAQPQGEYSGYDYLINIKTRPNYEGYEGNIYGLYNQYFNNEARKGIATLNPSSYAYYTKNKLTLYAKANLYWTHTGHDFEDSRDFEFDGMSETTQRLPGNNKMIDNLTKSVNARMMADYQFRPKSTLSLQYSYTYTPSDLNGEYEKFIRDSSHPDGMSTPYIANRHDIINRHSASIFYRNYVNRVKFNTNLQYSIDNTHTDGGINQGDIRIDYNVRNRLNLLTYNASANTIIGRNTSVFGGYNLTYKDYTQHNSITGDFISSNRYIRHKIYAGVTQPIGTKVRISLTPFVEFIHSEGSGKSFNQTPFGANGFIYYNISRKFWARFDYGVYSQYPSQDMVADWGYFSDPYIWWGGNPSLKSTVMHNLSLQVNLFNSLNIRGGYSTNPDAMFTIGSIEEGMLPNGEYGRYLAYRPYNGEAHSLWGQVTYSHRFGKGFSGNASYRIERSETSAFGEGNSGYQHRISMTGRYNNNRYGLGVWVTYVLIRNTTPSPQEISKKFIENPYITLSKFLCGKKLQLSLVYGSFFRLFEKGYTRTMKDIAGIYRSNSYSPYWERNKIEFTLTYRFWGGKSIKAYEQGISEER